MQIVVMSKGDPERLWTTKWLDAMGKDYSVVTHYQKDAEELKKHCKGRVLYTNRPSLLRNRNTVLEKLVPRGEWFIGMDDNIRLVNTVHPSIYKTEQFNQEKDPLPVQFKTWREAYRYDATKNFEELCNGVIRRCENEGTIYGGFASMENPYFRQRKWSFVRFVKSKLFVMKNVPGLAWKGGDYAHDSWMSAYVVATYGCVVVNNFVHPVHKMYERGGLGHVSERRKYLDPLLESIIEEFPGLVKKGKGENTALRFLLTNKNSVQRWKETLK